MITHTHAYTRIHTYMQTTNTHIHTYTRIHISELKLPAALVCIDAQQQAVCVKLPAALTCAECRVAIECVCICVPERKALHSIEPDKNAPDQYGTPLRLH